MVSPCLFRRRHSAWLTRESRMHDRFHFAKLVGSVGRLLSENLESSRAAMAECSAAVFGHGDLSKEQIRELILKKQDKENTAEM